MSGLLSQDEINALLEDVGYPLFFYVFIRKTKKFNILEVTEEIVKAKFKDGWFNNGSVSKQFPLEEQIPKGFIRGRLKVEK